MTKRAKWGLGLTVVLMASGCSTNGAGLGATDGPVVDGGDAGASAGRAGTGTGGGAATGGASGSGGAISTGGTGVTGGTTGSGGATGGAGGRAATGGAGGRVESGGAGGRVGSGGAGGRVGSGGAGGASCGGLAGRPCPNPDQQFCELPAGTCLVVADAAGTCVGKPEGCSGQYDPVCGCDGQTYGNDCQRRGAGVSRASTGACAAAVSP